jgi:hypothetical protein
MAAMTEVEQSEARPVAAARDPRYRVLQTALLGLRAGPALILLLLVVVVVTTPVFFTESASVAQHPDKIGSLGVATLYAATQGKKVPKNVDTGTSLITRENAK